MRRTPSVRAAVLLPALAVLAALVATLLTTASPPGSSASVSSGAGERGPRASLRISPDKHYVGGQALTFRGNIGRRGVHRMVFQNNGGRPGDTWETIEGFSTRTRRDGSFSFSYPAPSMYGMRYRLKSGSAVTPPVRFDALLQDLVLHVQGQPYEESQSVVQGRPFTIQVNTVKRLNPVTQGLRPIPGRTLTLQRRVDGDSWKTLGRTKVDRKGLGEFDVDGVDATGAVVYRVRQENWFKGNNRIGWFPSFPTYVEVRAARSAPGSAATVPAPLPEGSAAAGSSARYAPRGGQGASTTASQRYRWAPSLFDYAWVLGESLTSPPYRGTSRKKGGWLDYTDGSGRVNKQNGGLILDSKRSERAGPGDFGTSRATLRVNALTRGRWETRMRVSSEENNAEDYRVRVQLVPARAPNDACHTITLADIAAHSAQMRFGAVGGGRRWSSTKGLGNIQNKAIAFAVELGRDHITWFVEGRPVGTLKGKDARAAISGKPMTMRISMVGQGRPADRVEMNQTFAISDWQRGFTMGSGRQVRSGKPLGRPASAPGC